MIVEAEVDFDFAIENFFVFFEDGLETGESDLLPSQPTCNSKSTKPRIKKGKDINHKDVTLLVTPKIMKNDIRRYYSRMFMNTINSGDFNQLQNYFSTFMRGPAKFQADYGNFNPILRLPSQLVANGPKLMSHFLLGVFVMYPDMVMHMNDTRIITSSSWAGTKIEMSVDFFATKMYDLSMEEWIPQLQTLEEKCNRMFALPSGGVLSADKDWCKFEGKNKSFASSSSVVVRRGAGREWDLRASDRHESNDTGAVPSIPTSKNKRKRATGANQDLSLTSGSVRADSIALSSVSRTASPLCTLSSSSTNIPEGYVHALCAQAALLPTPMELRMTGMVTLFLDENNHIQHMHMKVHPM